MNEAVRALGTEEVTELIGNHIAAFLDGGPNRKAEDIELGREAGLDFEILALWDEAERQVQVSLKPIEVVVLPPQGKVEPLTALPAQEAENEALERPAASKPNRRSLPPDEVAKSKADLFISPSIQPGIGEQKNHNPSRNMTMSREESHQGR